MSVYWQGRSKGGGAGQLPPIFQERVANDYARLTLTLLPGVAKTEGGKRSCSHGAMKSRARNI